MASPSAPCLPGPRYRAENSDLDDVLGHAALMNSTSRLPGVTLDGECLRGGTMAKDDSYYVICNQINALCTLIFTLEIMLQFAAEGFKYFDKAFNQFDVVIVLVCLVDLRFPIPAVAAARLFRIANLVSKGTRFKSLQIIINSIQNSIGPLSGVVTLAFLFLFVFAVGGMQLYGKNLPGYDRLHFRDFSHSILTVFVMFTGDGWSDIMYKIMAEEGESQAIFFVIFSIYGMFGLSMLILATLISKFDCGTKEDFAFGNVLPIGELYAVVARGVELLKKGSKRKQLRRQRILEDLRRRGLAPPEDKEEKTDGELDPEKEAKRKAEAEAAAAAKALKERTKKMTKAEKEAEKQRMKEADMGFFVSDRDKQTQEAQKRYFVQAEHCLLDDHPSLVLRRCAEQTQEQITIDTTPEELNGNIGYGACMITPDGPLREYFLSKIVDQPAFENFILFCIIASCITLAIEGPGLSEGNMLKEVFYITDLVFLGVFFLECILRIAHKGLLFTNVAYLK